MRRAPLRAGLPLLALLAAGCAERAPATAQRSGTFDQVMQRLAEQPGQAVAMPRFSPGGPAGAPGAVRSVAGARRAVLDPGQPLRSSAAGRVAMPPGAAAAEAGTVTLNFVEAELPQVVQAVLGDLLRADFTVDPRLAGTITLQTQRPVPTAAAASLLEAALAANGAAMLGGPSGYRIVPLETALQSGPPAAVYAARAGGRPEPGFSILALPLAHARAADLQRVLQPLVPRGGAAIADEARNILLLAGTAQQLSTLIEVAESFDEDWLRGRSVALLPLESAPAALVAQEITAVFGGEGGEGGGRSPSLRVVPIARLNALLVVAAQPQQLERVRRWARELDAGLGVGPQLFVHPVQYVRATQMAATLRQLLQGDAAVRSGAGALLAPGQTGVLAVAGATSAPVLPPEAGLAPGGSAVNGLAPSAAVPTTPGLPAAPQPGLGTDGTAAPADGGLPAAPIRVVADEAQNALIVYANPTDWRLVERAILALDRPPLQVAIDATIAEVTLNDDLEYGLSWFFRAGNFEFRLANAPSGVVGPSFPGFNAFYTGGVDAGAVLRALSSVTNVRVISSPQVMVLSNQTARLRVGDSVPIVTQQAIGGGITDARIVNSVTLRDTGVSLDVTPRVNSAGGVLLEVDQDVSDAIRTTTSGIDSPTIQQRRLRSIVSVPSGETIALGGLIREADSAGRSGLPFVGDIPGLRELFGVTSATRRRTELLVLITPRLVQNTEEMRRVTEELRLRMRSMAPRPPAAPPARLIDGPAR